MKRFLSVVLFSFFILFSGCFLQKPQKVEVEYYDDGHVKQIRKYYKDRMKVRYYALEKKKKKPFVLFFRKK